MVGAGALGGALFLASLKAGTDLKKILLINTIVFGAGLMIFSLSTVLLSALPFLVACGFGMMSQTTISNTLIQTTVTSDMRGRVISFYAMAFFGMQPVGGLIIGSIAAQYGAQWTLFTEGVITIIIALAFLPFLRSRRMKPSDKMKMEQLEERTAETS